MYPLRQVGKAADFDSAMRWFESIRGCHIALQLSWSEHRLDKAGVLCSSHSKATKYRMALQLSWQSNGLKIRVSLVRNRSKPPFINALLDKLVKSSLSKGEVLPVRIRGRVPKFSRSRLMVRTLIKRLSCKGYSQHTQNSMSRKRSGFESRLWGHIMCKQ